MQRIWIILVLVMLTQVSISQSKPKPKPAEKPPTQQEIDAMMKEMEGAMNYPEVRKMMEAQGIKMPNTKSIPKFTDQQYAKAKDEADRQVPAKDVQRIAAIQKQPLTDAAMPAYLNNTYNKLQAAMLPELLAWAKTKSDSMITQYGNGATLAQIALNCYLVGLYDLGLYLMGKVALNHPKDPTFLNNYAAMLNTGGAQHLALPILQNLNRQYPKDYKVVNNIGQAWYGLGDMQMALKYIDSAIRLYPRNPQALHTKAKIETEKGNKEAAKKALEQSLEEAFTDQKDYELRQLENKPDENQKVRWTMPVPKDAFGLGNFLAPEFPMSIRESEMLEPKWEDFRQKCMAIINDLKARQTAAEQEAAAAMEKRQQEVLAGKSSVIVPWLSSKAAFKIKALQESDRKGSHYAFYEAEKKFLNIDRELEPLKDEFSAKEAAIEEKYAPLFGEGKQNPFEAHCAEINNVRNEYLSKTNTLVHDRYMAYITQLKVMTNEKAEYYLYANFSEDYEVMKLHLQQYFLTALIAPPVQFRRQAATCPRPSDKVKDTTTVLSNFYDRHCEYQSEFYVPLIGKWTQRCDIMTVELFTKIPLGPASLSLGGKYVINSDAKHENGTVEIGVGVGIGDKTTTAITNTGLKVEGKTIIHLTDRGITDIELAGGVGLKTGFGGEMSASKDISPIVKGSITHAGLEGQFSIMNGPPASGKVKFMDIKL